LEIAIAWKLVMMPQTVPNRPTNGAKEPTYHHHTLVTHADGRRLAKRDLAPTLAAMRDERVDGRVLASSLSKGQLPLGFAFGDG
jgi:glutamyl-Q tRNA(Asp) synthetase